MSAPDTNIERQEKRHAPSLLGIKGAMIFGALMLIAILGVAMLSSADSGATAYEGSPAAAEAEEEGTSAAVAAETEEGSAGAAVPATD